jgi:hypothetical protein
VADENAKEPSVELDGETRELKLRAERAKLREEIAKSEQAAASARAASLRSVVPTVADAPKGEVTLGDKAGAVGPWRAHRLVDAVAREIAAKARALLPAGSARVLVVDDRSLLRDHWTARHVLTTLALLRDRLTHLDQTVQDTLADLEPAPSGTTRRGGREAAAPPPPRGGPAPAPTAATAGAEGALGAAVDLLGLLRTDYTVTAIAVPTTATELSSLTAGHLAATGTAAASASAGGTEPVTVELDGFTTVRPSPTLDAVRALEEAREASLRNLVQLEARVAPVDGQPAAGRAKAVATHARQVLAGVDSAVADLLKAPEGADAPLVTAVRRERLSAEPGPDGISHVLYVHLDAVAADALTRRSILGTSSRIRFLSAVNASWILLDTSTGTVVGGGQANQADLTTFGLDTGVTDSVDVVAQPGPLPSEDRLEKLEESARQAVVALVILLAVLSLVAFVAVIA